MKVEYRFRLAPNRQEKTHVSRSLGCLVQGRRNVCSKDTEPRVDAVAKPINKAQKQNYFLGVVCAQRHREKQGRTDGRAYREEAVEERKPN